jgi:hypothetical protein
MDKLPNFRPDTITTWLNAKLLLQQIVRKIVSPAVALPSEPPASPASPPATPSSEVRETLRRLTHEIVDEMWRVTVLVHQSLRAALNPIALRDVPRALAACLEHISRRNEQKRPKQIVLLLLEVDTAPS